ncbi:MAG TPA: histidine--tRNA ligase [Candidatus Doudnabacteria bacterium]|nr:histidine--tRNA ligase [Candidatus Doudnabacteria bacterium]
MRIEPRTLKGFRDYGAREQAARQTMFATIQTVFEQFGFSPLSTPVLEFKEILMGKYGDDEKLVYSFQDNGGRDVAMRYDLTVPLARYVAQNQGSLQWPFKRYQIAPVWRADNPQKGRLREFYQCDVDVVGTDNVLADAEVIACVAKALEALGLSNYKIRINDRAVFAEFSQETIRIIDKVEKIGIESMTEEMRERGVSATEISAAIKLVLDGKQAVPQRLAEVINILNQFSLNGQIDFDTTIARGLDYYSGTVFEIVLPEKPEYGSIAAGGRYDGLLSQFSAEDLPAVGASIGIDRLYGALDELGLLPQTATATVLVLNLAASAQTDYLALAGELRAAGIKTELYYEPAKLDKQFKYAERRGIIWAVIFGSEEQASGKVKLKNLTTREQLEVPRSELLERLINT